jgi:hypothetical protein
MFCSAIQCADDRRPVPGLGPAAIATPPDGSAICGPCMTDAACFARALPGTTELPFVSVTIFPVVQFAATHERHGRRRPRHWRHPFAPCKRAAAPPPNPHTTTMHSNALAHMRSLPTRNGDNIIYRCAVGAIPGTAPAPRSVAQGRPPSCYIMCISLYNAHLVI